jgi:outer membrane protein assembly factor BamA
LRRSHAGPGFNRGLRLLRAGGTAALALGERVRHGTGARLSTGALLAQGIAGDPSRHVRLDAEGVFSLAGLDRVLLLRLHGATVEALGSAPVPFTELVPASGPAGMRGYAEGRFRGDSALVATAEYRWLISFRLDASLFTDLGTVAGPRFSGLFDSPDLFPSFGVGVRWHESTTPHWTAVPTAGFQIAYGIDAGFRLLVSMAAF